MTPSADPDDRSVLGSPAPAPTRTERYGYADEQVYDVYLPTGASRGWVVLIHGGFWRAEWDRTHLRPLAAALAGHGHSVALIEYARTGMNRGGFPGTFHDVAAALAAVRGREVGPGQRVVIVGHSAGGQLAAWAVRQPEARGARGAISLAGCLDLTLVAELGLDHGAAVDLMGGSPADLHDAYGVVDPARLGPTPYPVVAIHGSDDTLVPPAVTQSWWERAADHDRDRLVALGGAGHFTVIGTHGPAFEELLAQTTWLIERE